MKNNNEISDFLEYLEKKLYSKSTISCYGFAIIDFFKYLDTINTDYISFNNINVLDYIENLNGTNTKQTINSKIYSIKKYVEFLEKQKNILIPLKLTPSKTHNKKPIKVISDINVILKYVDEIEKNEIIRMRDKLLISMIYYCGFRTKDILKIKVSDINEYELYINNKIFIFSDFIANDVKKLIETLKLSSDKYLFYNFSPGRKDHTKKHLTEKSAESIFNRYKVILNKNLSIRDLRNSYCLNIERYFLEINIITITSYSEFNADCDYLCFKE